MSFVIYILVTQIIFILKIVLEFSKSYHGRGLHDQFSRYVRHLKTWTEKENTEKFITEVWRRTLKILIFKFCSRFNTKVIIELKIQ